MKVIQIAVTSASEGTNECVYALDEDGDIFYWEWHDREVFGEPKWVRMKPIPPEE